MDAVIKFTETIEGETRVLSEPFMKLPSRRKLAHYYEVIKRPIDIKKILSKIEDGKVSKFHF